MASAAIRPRRGYRSGLREDQAFRTRRRVIDGATAVFLESGFGATTMKAVALAAGVSVATVEGRFGTKARLLKAAIDVAIAGDDEPTARLDRPWATAARDAQCMEELLSVVAGVVGPAQERSAGLVLAVFEGASKVPELEALAAQMTAQRAATAGWVVERMTSLCPLRPGCGMEEAVDTVWILMDPAVFTQLTRERGWSTERYQRWMVGAVTRLLLAQGPPRVEGHRTRSRQKEGSDGGR